MAGKGGYRPNAGRKTRKVEEASIQRIVDLVPATAGVLRENFNSKDKQDNKWATEQMMKLMTKIIPSQILLDAELNTKQPISDEEIMELIKSSDEFKQALEEEKNKK